MKILELFDDQRENFGTDFMSSFKQAAGAGASAKAPADTSSESAGPFAGANPKLLKQAVANIINGKPLDSAQMQIFQKAYNKL